MSGEGTPPVHGHRQGASQQAGVVLHATGAAPRPGGTRDASHAEKVPFWWVYIWELGLMVSFYSLTQDFEHVARPFSQGLVMIVDPL